MIAAIIPARGGSVRIPGKNIKEFYGKPIIHYPIEAARKSGLFDKIIVSTDSEEIAKAAVDAGAEAPFIRPRELSGNTMPTAPVLLHAVEYLNKNVSPVKYFCCMYPTAAMLRCQDIIMAFQMLQEKKAAEVFAITSFEFCIFRAMKRDKNGCASFLWPENGAKLSQEFPEAYHDAGLFYWFDAKAFLEDKTLYHPQALGFVLPHYLVCDIDTPDDWQRAEIVYKACKTKGLL